MQRRAFLKSALMAAIPSREGQASDPPDSDSKATATLRYELSGALTKYGMDFEGMGGVDEATFRKIDRVTVEFIQPAKEE